MYIPRWFSGCEMGMGTGTVTRGTNRAAPRGILRKTRSHQDSRMFVFCCTVLTCWPLQLPSTIKQDPVRVFYRKKYTAKRRRDTASHVLSFPFDHSSFQNFLRTRLTPQVGNCSRFKRIGRRWEMGIEYAYKEKRISCEGWVRSYVADV